MYSILLCCALGLALSFSGVLLDLWSWPWTLLFAPVITVAAFVLWQRRLARRLQPAMQRLQKQMEAGHWETALQACADLMPMARWVPMLRGMLLANMGLMAHNAGDQQRAVQLLQGASPRAGEAQLLLASILYRDGDAARALQALRVAAVFNKKHSLLHNTWAWMLHKSQRGDEAQQVLAAFLKKNPADEAAKDNLLRLQNRTRMTMHGFGMQWYALRLEQPPQELGQIRRAAKGFREPPKRRGG